MRVLGSAVGYAKVVCPGIDVYLMSVWVGGGEGAKDGLAYVY